MSSGAVEADFKTRWKPRRMKDQWRAIDARWCTVVGNRMRRGKTACGVGVQDARSWLSRAVSNEPKDTYRARGVLQCSGMARAQWRNGAMAPGRVSAEEA